jgi:tetratricopeptide (TPR) repeat protein
MSELTASGKIKRPTRMRGNFRPPIGRLLLCTILLLIGTAGYAQISHIEASARLLNEGKLDLAEQEARLAEGNPTTRPLALAMLGTIRLREGKYGESSDFLTKALELNPRMVGARTSLGDAYVLQGKSELARNCFQEVLRLNPANYNARQSLAQLETSLQHYQRSLDVARPIVTQLKQSEEGILLLATNYTSLGDAAKAKEMARSWMELPQTTENSSIEFGLLLMNHGMAHEASEVLEKEKLKSAGHPSSTLALELGQAYSIQGDLSQADLNFQLALALNPTCVICDQEIARVAERQDNTEKALAYMIKAKQLAPEDPEVLFEFGKICLERNLIDDALPALQKAVALKPDHDPYVYVLASAKVARGDRDQASLLFEQLLKKHPEDPVLRYAVGAVYYLQGKFTEAESYLQQSIQAQPDQIAAYYYLALTYDSMGQGDRAVALFRDLLKRHPDHAPAHANLGKILLRQRKYDEALAELERAVALDPGFAQAHYQLALVLRRTGKTAESDQEFALAHKLETERHARTDQRLRLLLPD